MNVVFLGQPGAGKGTQAEQLVEKMGFAHLSTGELLRDAVSAGSDLGKAAEGYMDRGELVPDDIILKLLVERIEGLSGGKLLLDGYPRNLAQGEKLQEVLSESGQSVDLVLNLSVPEDEVIKRLKSRGRSDDNAQTIEQRLNVYQAKTKPLIEFYKSQGILREINGLGSVSEIFSRIESALMDSQSQGSAA